MSYLSHDIKSALVYLESLFQLHIINIHIINIIDITIIRERLFQDKKKF